MRTNNPAEREIVRTQIKGAAVPDMDGVENYITTIDRSGFFEVTTFSEDDLKRNEMYKKNALRAAGNGVVRRLQRLFKEPGDARRHR